MINSFLRLYAVAPGFDPKGLMTFQIPFSYGKFVRDTGRRTPSGSLETEITPLLAQTSEQVRARLAAIPGVQSVAFISTVPPLVGFARQFPFTIGGKQTEPAQQEAQSAEYYPVSSKYFETLQIPILRGREFTAGDSAAGQPVILINSTMAKRFWPKDDAIGQQIQLKYFNEPRRQIIGIVGDVRQNARNDIKPQVYLPIAQLPLIQQKNQSAGLELITFIVRSKGDAKQLTAAFRPAVAEVDRTQPIFHIQPLEQYISDQMQGFRQYVLMLGVFGGVALVLALIGIYGIMAHTVTQRTNEIGIRMALGASSRQVLRLVLRRGLLLIGIGLVLGLAASVGLTRVISSQLWGVTATDPITFAFVVAGLASVAVLACYIPARRALKVDPVIALRYE
jgi:putative ABC transport system permease protein